MGWFLGWGGRGLVSHFHRLRTRCFGDFGVSVLDVRHLAWRRIYRMLFLRGDAKWGTITDRHGLLAGEPNSAVD